MLKWIWIATQACFASHHVGSAQASACDVSYPGYADHVFSSLIFFPRQLPITPEMDRLIESADRLEHPDGKLCLLINGLTTASLTRDECLGLVSHFDHLKASLVVEAKVVSRFRQHLLRRAGLLCNQSASPEEQAARSALKQAGIDLYEFGLQLSAIDEAVESLTFRFHRVAKTMSRGHRVEILSSFQTFTHIPPYFTGAEVSLMSRASISNIIATVNAWRIGLLSASDLTCNSVLSSAWAASVVPQTRQVLHAFTVLLQEWFIDDSRLELSREAMEGVVLKSQVVVAQLEEIESRDRMVVSTERGLRDVKLSLMRFAESMGFMLISVNEEGGLADDMQLSIDREIYNEVGGITEEQNGLRDALLADCIALAQNINSVAASGELPALDSVYDSIEMLMKIFVPDENGSELELTNSDVADIFDAFFANVEAGIKEVLVVKGCLSFSRTKKRDLMVARRLGKVWDGIKIAITAWIHATNAMKIRLADLTV